MAIEIEDRLCKNCVAYEPTKGECRKTSVFQAREPGDWCMEFTTWDVQDHPGAAPDEHWKMVGRVRGVDSKLVTNPLGRDLLLKTLLEV